MPQSELSERNFKRISLINWVMSLPLMFIFSWPYVYICQFLNVEAVIAYTGAILFSIPFMTTILHGNVTVALGSAHRHHYYRWLSRKPLTYGLFFNPVFMRTRFRLILVTVSFLMLTVGWFFDFYNWS
jgi:hypothetical protein